MKQDDTRLKLIDGTIHVIARDGLDKATTKSIGEETSINQAYIYRHFEDKEDMFAKTFESLDEELVNKAMQHIPVMYMQEMDYEIRCWVFFTSVWKFMHGNKDKCLTFIRYYYSPYFKQYAAEFLAASNGGNLFLTDDINYNNTDPEKQLILEATNAINFDGNGSTITSAGADPSVGNHGYVAFVPSAGEDVTVSDLTVTGTGFVELGDYGLGGGDYVANNLVVKDLVSTLANGDKGFTLACGFAHYGNATLNDCVMTGTTAMIDGAMAVDAGFVNGTTTTVNGGKYGTIYCWSHANVTIDDAEIDTIYVSPIKGNVTIKAGTVIDNLIVDYGTSASNVTKARLEKLVIEDGAEVGAIVYNGTTYTVAEWNAYLATL